MAFQQAAGHNGRMENSSTIVEGQNRNAGDGYWKNIGEGRTLTDDQKAKSVGHESGSEYNISGNVVGAAMVGVVTGGTNNVTSHPAAQGEKKAESNQEAAGANTTDAQEAVGGNATDGPKKAAGHESGSVYNIRPQIFGAGIIGVVSGGTNTVEHSTVTPGEQEKAEEGIGRNATDGQEFEK